VLLDVDGVLADFLGFAIQTMEELSGRTYTREQFTDWDLFQTFDPAWKHEFFYECARPGVAARLARYEGVSEGVSRLQGVAEVYAVTAPMRNSPFWYTDRAGWLSRQVGIPDTHLVYTEAKHLCRGDVFVDDKPENVMAWTKENPDGIGLLWEAPYNRLDRGLTRATSWDDVVEAVRLQTERIDRGVLCEDSR